MVNSFPKVSETFIFNKVVGLSKRGVDVTVVFHDDASDRQAFRADWEKVKSVKIERAFSRRDILGFRLYRTIASRGIRSIAILKGLYALDKKPHEILKDYFLWLSVANRFDIIHFEYTGLAITYFNVLPYLKPAIVFTSCRGAAEQIRPLVDKARAQQLTQLFNRVDQVHCVSKNMLDDCMALYLLNPRKAFVNRPAIDPGKFHRRNGIGNQSSNAPFVICSTGRLHWKKGFEYALLAMKRLGQKGLNFRYEIIGGGVELEKLAFMAHDLGIRDKVFFVGALSSVEVISRLESCDIFVSPSLSEGISNAVLEAMAMEVPVVATRAGGMAEVISHNETGLLVDAYNDAQLADALELLMRDKILRDRLGRNGLTLIQAEYSIQRQMDVFVDRYNSSIYG